MTQYLTDYWIANVTCEYAHEASRFHKGFAENNPHIWPRTEGQIQQFIEDGCLFAAWTGEELVALCYASLDESEKVWEIGGLTVDPSIQRKGIGGALVRFTIAHTFVYEQPWSNNQRIVAHVHEANNDPRRILEQIGFSYSHPIEVSGDEAPSSMKRDSDGNIRGDEFEFSAEGLKNLADWFKQDFDKRHIQFKLGANINDFRTALDELAAEH